MKAKQNLRLVLIAVLTAMMLAFSVFAVACNKDGDKKGDNSSTTTSSQDPGESSSQTPTSSSTGGDITEEPKTKPNTTIGQNDTVTVPDGYKEVKTSLNFNVFEAASVSEEIRNGVFTIQTNTEVRTRQRDWSGMTSYTDYPYLNLHKTLEGATSISKEVFTHSLKIGSTGGLKISVPGDGYISVYVQNGSTGAGEQAIVVNNQRYAFCGQDYSSPVVQFCLDVTQGEYLIKRESGTLDVFMVELHCAAVDSEPVGISVATMPQTSFLAGQEFNFNGLVVGLNYEDGVQDALLASEYEVDASAVDMTKAGTYNVNITYKENPEFSCSYEVKVNELKEITVGTYATEKIANTTAGNGVYYNKSVKTVYALNEALDTKYITVNAYDTDGNLYLFKNDSEFVSYTNVDGTAFSTAAVGNYTVKVTLELNGVAKTGTYEVSVIDTAIATENGTAYVYVDSAYTGANGAVATPVGLEAACNQFKTLGMALEYLRNTNLNGMPVTMYIAAGEYREKIEVDVPNLTMIGLGETNEDVLIEWNSLYGVKDESGYEQTTDSTQSVAVRENAINCTMQNLTISNYWNSAERFIEADKTAENRALALLVQADKFIMDNCRLLGYQDTVELFKGRQLIKNSYICGVTDFIFGTNNTTYFYNCEIESIKHIKGNGGYLTAFKGCSSGANDYVQYGAIFDNCDFTAETGVTTMAIGRTWGAYAAVAVINSRLGGHISKTVSGRYIGMNANPTEPTVKFVEYGNTGDGAITESQSGVTYLDAATAANYSDFSVIFGTKNGMVTYSDTWNPAL